MIVSIKECALCPNKYRHWVGKVSGTILFLLFMTACSEKPVPPPDIRAVKAITISSEQSAMVDEFSGEVKPKIESKLGFRVGGKIIARKVEVGDLVQPKQVLMQLDAQDLKLMQQQADSALKAALSNRDLAQAELHRYQELREKNFVNQATLDAKTAAYQSAQSSYEQALASSRNQSNQTGYSTLVADIKGVVTSINGEVGQVVAAGTPVVSVAQLGDKDVVISVPENKVDTLKQVQTVYIRLWAQPDNKIVGHIREISPVADPVTRTYLVKIAMPDTSDEVKLGMTAYVSLVNNNPNHAITLPLTALYKQGDKTAVWVVKDGQVHLTPIILSGVSGNDVVVSSGIRSGDIVVIAGVNMLKENQKVDILNTVESEPVSDTANGATHEK